MRLSGTGLAAALLAISGVEAPAGVLLVPPGTGGLKIAAENSVSEAQWVGGGNGLGAQRYRWHKRPAFFQGTKALLRNALWLLQLGLLQLWSVRSAPYHAAVVVWPDSLTDACHCRRART